MDDDDRSWLEVDSVDKFSVGMELNPRVFKSRRDLLKHLVSKVVMRTSAPPWSLFISGRSFLDVKLSYRRSK